MRLIKSCIRILVARSGIPDAVCTRMLTLAVADAVPLGPMQGCFAALAYGSGRSGKQRDHGFLRGARFSLLPRGRGQQEKFPIDKLEREWGLAASGRCGISSRGNTTGSTAGRPVPEQAFLLDHRGGLRRHQLFPACVAGLDACQHCARRDVQLAGVELAYGCDVTVLDEMSV